VYSYDHLSLPLSWKFIGRKTTFLSLVNTVLQRHLFCCSLASWLRGPRERNHQTSILCTNSISRVFETGIGLLVIAMIGAAAGIGPLVYPCTGLTFSVAIITMICASKIDFVVTICTRNDSVGEIQPVNHVEGVNYSVVF